MQHINFQFMRQKMLVTFSNKFSALDNREAGLLEELSGDDRVAFEQLYNSYEAEFRPEASYERDTVYCLATLRWGIDRIRACEESTRAIFRAHGYTPAKMKSALDELAGYQRELNIRYEYFFSHYLQMRSQKAA
jgi:hypothetical protein